MNCTKFWFLQFEKKKLGICVFSSDYSLTQWQRFVKDKMFTYKRKDQRYPVTILTFFKINLFKEKINFIL